MFSRKKLLISALLALIACGASPAFALKSLVYNGIECATRNNDANNKDVWIPSTPGLYGFDATVTYCPIIQARGEGYGYNKLSYVMLYGINLKNPRLCRRASNGAVQCGTSAPIGTTSWILYKPAGGGTYDDVFLSVNVGTGISLIRDYAVVYQD